MFSFATYLHYRTKFTGKQIYSSVKSFWIPISLSSDVRLVRVFSSLKLIKFRVNVNKQIVRRRHKQSNIVLCIPYSYYMSWNLREIPSHLSNVFLNGEKLTLNFFLIYWYDAYCINYAYTSYKKFEILFQINYMMSAVRYSAVNIPTNEIPNWKYWPYIFQQERKKNA